MRMLSPLISIAAGSVAGLTFFRNQYHQICVRARTAPVNPSTSNQTAVRTAFSFANAGWDSMGSGNRTFWADYATTLVYTGPLGDYHIPGRQVWIGSATFLQFINIQGYDTITIDATAPNSAGFAKFDEITDQDPAVPGTGFDLILSQTTGDNMAVLIDISVGFNPARQRFKGPWAAAQQRYLDLATGVTANVPIDDLTEGQAYFYRIRGVTSDGPHKMTAAFIGRAVAATNP